ncbi:hypothetical protein BDN72DRAFT_291432 [Pluteus cervinus]|uniref:Uncharacterized protein n=1 Tax=Pluteus cervinus TaxID=181527 RepID=A0ACD3AF01_9AGAR|nr:hypothetical protein BDN72DRAFT_291432 [Pluteus cervinus]
MSADWAWKTADIIANDPSTHGAMLIPIIVGSDKTTVSVATGHQQYHPVYISPGNLTNTARRAHTNAVLPVAFLPIPKTNRKQRKRREWKKFCRQLYHTCFEKIFLPLEPGMTTPELIRCPDHHLRRGIYNLGPHVMDYIEQVWMAAIVQMWCAKCLARPENLDQPGVRQRTQRNREGFISAFDSKVLWDEWGIRDDIVPYTHQFPRADIHELITPDLLHQIIKGVFKDHLVTWVSEYLVQRHGEAQALEIIKDIDRRISSVPAFPGLRRFPDGRDFQQWTGDDSKALMKVYLPAITGYVPPAMISCISAFLDFAYLARRNSLSSTDLEQLEHALTRFTQHRTAFIQEGFQTSLPRQHSLQHYIDSIRLFGSPNGLCSSIMESKHIKAVKEPWRRSNRYNALIQMLRTIERTDKLNAVRSKFTKRGMMVGTTFTYTAAQILGEALPFQPQPDDEEWDDDIGPVSGPKDLTKVSLAVTREPGYPRDLNELGIYIHQPEFPEALQQFLWGQLHPDSTIPSTDVPDDDLPTIKCPVYVHHSAVARFYAPSDLCGAGGMKQERIRSHPHWKNNDARWDTAFIETDADQPGMLGFTIGRVLLFFSFRYLDQRYECALVHWLVRYDEEPDPETGLWIVCPEYGPNQQRTIQVVHVKSIARGAHLIPIYGSDPLPEDFEYTCALDSFQAYYVNSYADNHIHELLHVSS